MNLKKSIIGAFWLVNSIKTITSLEISIKKNASILFDSDINVCIPHPKGARSIELNPYGP